LGEHLPYKQEVVGSSPSAPTKTFVPHEQKAVMLSNGAEAPHTRLMEQRVGRAGRSDQADAVLSFPWETTPLGSIETWPEQLRLLVQVMLGSAFPMMLVWGRELIQLYNDAFRPILGTAKHPGALGGSAHDTWREIWDEIGPRFARVFDDGEAVWNADQRLLIDRNDYMEETFFTYSYSPIHDHSDAVVGLLVIANETTAQVVDRRRLSSLGALASALVSTTAIESVAKATIEALQDCADVPAVEISAVVADSVVRIAGSREPVTLASERELVRRAATAPDVVVLDDDWQPARTAQPARPARRVIFGIDGPGLQTVVGIRLNEERPFDEQYQQFVQVIRQTVAASMAGALLRAAELGALRHISDTLQHAMLELASDLPTVAARYLPKTSTLTVGGDWYDVLDLGNGRRALIVGDCVGHDLEAATPMGALRNVSRALLTEGRAPAAVVDSLHRFAMTMPAASCATVVCVIVDLAAQTITYSNAGHPPPLLIHDTTPIWLDQATTPPLAVGSPVRVEAQVDTSPGDVLVLYTDGLVERRGEIIDRGFQRLADCAIGCRDESVQNIADQLIERLVDRTPGDDVALIVKRIH
jgi:serine phosphatase RsbU (regulator of sigma subunit)/PAS domain-containing protein